MRILLILFILLSAQALTAQTMLRTDVLVVGGGTGGTAAGIQSARLGVNTIIAEPGPWLGGMISAAGVSATDGNHNLPSGIWNEFREAIYKVYGGRQQVATGWISLTHFEPRVADSIFKAMAAREKKLSVLYHHALTRVIRKNKQVQGAHFRDTLTGKNIVIYAKQVIEATELGDVIALAGVPHDLGMESGEETGEDAGIKATNDIIQDLTYVAILKDFGSQADKTIPEPDHYQPQEFDGACTDYYHDSTRNPPAVDARKMLDYARLPHQKYMINWPRYGNDIYLNIIPLSPSQRQIELEKAKQQTLRFVYFIQHQLGFKNLGLADDEFPSSDRLALMPYHRESRRVRGLTRLLVNHIANPFSSGLYRTGISVGDYPIDHHHKKNPAAPQHLDFYPVPSFNIPLGCLVPAGINGLIVADKSISVSNVVNGTTRLQPVVLITGQAAGLLAALCVQGSKQARDIPVRRLQQALLEQNACLMPYIDAGISHTHFQSIQRIGSTGIIKGRGVPYQWANQTWFYPDSLMLSTAFTEGFLPFLRLQPPDHSVLTIGDMIQIIAQSGAVYKAKLKSSRFAFSAMDELTKQIRDSWPEWGLSNFDSSRPVTRAETAVMLDKTIDPFRLKEVDHEGNFKE